MLHLRWQGVAVSSRSQQTAWVPAWRPLPTKIDSASSATKHCVLKASYLPALDSMTTKQLFDKYQEACPGVHDKWLKQVEGDQSYWWQPLSACPLPDTAIKEDQTILQLSGALLKTATLHLREHPQVSGVVQVTAQPTLQPPQQPTRQTPQQSTQLQCSTGDPSVHVDVFLAAWFAGWVAVAITCACVASGTCTVDAGGAQLFFLVPIVTCAAAALSTAFVRTCNSNAHIPAGTTTIVPALMLACTLAAGLGWAKSLVLTIAASLGVCIVSVWPRLLAAFQPVPTTKAEAAAETFLAHAALSMPVSVKEWLKGAVEALALSLQPMHTLGRRPSLPALNMAYVVSLLALHTMGLKAAELGRLALQAASVSNSNNSISSTSLVANAPLLYAASLHTSIATTNLLAASNTPLATSTPVTKVGSVTCSSTSFSMLAAALAHLLACQPSSVAHVRLSARLPADSSTSSQDDNTNNKGPLASNSYTDSSAPSTSVLGLTRIQGYSYIITPAPDYSTQHEVLHTLHACLAAQPSLLSSMPKEQLLTTCSSLVSALQWAATGRSLPKQHLCSLITSNVWVDVGEQMLQVLQPIAHSEAIACQLFSTVLDIDLGINASSSSSNNNRINSSGHALSLAAASAIGGSKEVAIAEQLVVACNEAMTLLKKGHA